MTQYSIETRGGLPQEMQALLRDYPRDTWPENPNFAVSIRNWMGAHQMFRQLGEIVQTETESFLDGKTEVDPYIGRLAHFGNLLVRNLHGHHGWEDHSFFPELMAADPRFERGLDMLESDHVALDGLLDDFTTHSNRLIQLSQLDASQLETEAAKVRNDSEKLVGFLHRHLSDEEELAVPILLHHKMRG